MGDLFKKFIAGDLTLINQQSFEQYVTEGNNEFFHTPLSNLNNNEFLTLEKIVNEWSSFQISFESFYSERIKRFNRYG